MGESHKKHCSVRVFAASRQIKTAQVVPNFVVTLAAVGDQLLGDFGFERRTRRNADPGQAAGSVPRRDRGTAPIFCHRLSPVQSRNLQGHIWGQIQ